MGGDDWSPRYQQARDEVKMWSMLEKRLNGQITSSKELHRVRTRLGNPKEAFNCSLEQAREGKKKAHRRRKKEKKECASSRTTWMEQLGEARAAAGQSKAAKEIERIQREEKQRIIGRRLKSFRGKGYNGGMTAIIGPSDLPQQSQRQDWVQHDTQEDIEKVCAWENERRFRQTSDTPFMIPPLVNEVGYLGNTEAAESILAGTYTPPPGTDKYAAKLIPHLKRPECIANDKPVDISINKERHIRGWRKCKERTSAGPSPLTYSHFKAGSFNDVIAYFEALMSDIPYATGYSLSRWRKGIDVSIPKAKDNIYADKMRTILLMEADFNMDNKWLGKQAMEYAEDHNVLAPEQSGSRKNHTPEKCGLNKRLTLDILRQMKSAGAMVSNDAKSCYDRIIHAIASICLRRVGVPLPPIICMFSTLQNLEHCIRTAYGDSKLAYGGILWVVPMQGVMQGNGAGPAIWAIVSTPLLNMMREEGFGTHFSTSLTGDRVNFVGYAFVDDTDLVHTAKDMQTSGLQVALEMQEGLDLWEGGLKATGGAIVPQKSFWYLIDFKWSSGNWRYATTKDVEATLEVTDHMGNRKTIERLEPSASRKTLGFFMAPDGNNKGEVAFLRKATQVWGSQVETGHLDRETAWAALTTTIMKTIEYPLLALTLSEDECTHIMAPVLMQGLSKSGINRTMKRDIVYAPLKAQGFGLHFPYTTQGINHLEVMLTDGGTSTITGQLLETTLQALTLELGLPGEVFSHDPNEWAPALTDCWMVHTWQFCAKYNISVITGSPTLQPRRKHDIFLMAGFFRDGYREEELLTLNRCRIFLQVITSADIVTADGQRVRNCSWHGEMDTTDPSPYNWPNQGKPTLNDWILWRSAITKALQLRQSTSLRQPLGPWIDEPIRCQWFYSPTETRLYHRKPKHQWEFYQLLHTQRLRHRRFQYGGTCQTTPPDMRRASVSKQKGNEYLMTGFSDQEHSIPDPRFQTLGARIRSLPETVNWAILNSWVDDQGEYLAESIRQGTAIAVSDGSCHLVEQFSTSAFIMEGPDSQHRWKGVNVTPGMAKDHCSYRSELSGIYAIIVATQVLCRHHSITSGSVEVGVDAIETAKFIFERWRPITKSTKHADLIRAARAIADDTPIDWKFRHVEAHQSTKYPTKTLDRWAILNDEVDIAAKVYRVEMRQEGSTPHLIHKEGWAVTIDEAKITPPIRTQIYDHIHIPKAQKFWVEKKRFTREQIAAIAWDPCGVALRKSSRSRRKWLTKQVVGVCGVGKWLVRWNQRDTAQCPRCDEPYEDAKHVMLCQDPDAVATWKESVNVLYKWMKKTQTEPSMAEAIRTRLLQWHSGSDLLPCETDYPGLSTAIRAQDLLGWQNFLDGLLATEWEEVQNSYFQWLGSRRTGRRWVELLILKVWEVAWDQWQHRNGIAHAESEDAFRFDMDAIDCSIREEFIRGPQRLPSRERHLFSGSLEELLDKSARFRRAWLDSVELARSTLQTREYTHYQPERTLMESWLQH